MKILFVSSYYGEGEGGADISTRLLADSLRKNGVWIDIASINASSRPGVYPLIMYWPLPTQLIAFLLNTPFLDRYLAKRIQKVVSLLKPDILHVHDIMLLPAAVHVTKKMNIQCIVTVRDLRFLTNIPIQTMDDLMLDFSSPLMYLHYLTKQKGLLEALCAFPFIFFRPKTIRWALRRADHIVAISHFVKKQLITIGIDKEQINVVHNLAPEWKKSTVKKSQEDRNKVIFFSPGRLEHYKGFHLLIEAMREFKKLNVKLFIAGEGPEEKKLKALVASYGLLEQVIFLGKLPYEQIKEWYGRCDAVLFPSLWPEALGRVPLEARAAGKVCIASNVGGIPEITQRKYCVEANASAFAHAMNVFIKRLSHSEKNKKA